MARPIAVDLFCGGGGVAVGLMAAGYDVIGYDVEPQPDYPGLFVQRDAMTLSPRHLLSADFVWASPPCQAHIRMFGRDGKTRHPEMLADVVAMLDAYGVGRYAVECIPSAFTDLAVAYHLTLELGHFRAGMSNHRRRRFAVKGYQCPQPALRYPYSPCTVGLSGRGNKFARNRRRQSPTGPWLPAVQRIIGVEHIRTGTYAERTSRTTNAIPPCYAEYIGRYSLPDADVGQLVTATLSQPV